MSNRFLRRLQKIKTGSYIISLPMEWIKKNQLNHHAALYVIEDPDNNIIVKIPTSKCKATLQIDNLSTVSITDIVKVLYMQGISEIELRSERGLSEKLIQSIRNLRTDLIGLEIEDITRNSVRIVVKDGFENMDNSTYQKYFLKSIKYLKAALEDIRDSLGNGGAKDIKERMLEAKRIYRYLYRLLSLSIREPERRGLPSTLLVLYLENAVRLRETSYYIHRAADFLDKIEGDIELLRQMLDLAIQAIAALSKRDVEEVFRIRERVNELEEMAITRGNQYYVHLAFALRRIVHSLLRMAENNYIASIYSDTTCLAEAQKTGEIDQEVEL